MGRCGWLPRGGRRPCEHRGRTLPARRRVRHGARACADRHPHALAPGRRNIGFAKHHGRWRIREPGVTWDTRGHRYSKLDVDGKPAALWEFGDPEFEGVDAQRIIDKIATCDAIKLEAPGDPVLGWYGTSNGAGVQLNTAPFDPRIDAIAPYEAWGDLPENLVPDGVPKELGHLVVTNATERGVQLAPELQEFDRQIMGTSSITTAMRAWLAHRGTVQYAGSISAPALLMASSGDTLLGFNGALHLYETLTRNGVPARLIIDCEQHGGVNTPTFGLKAFKNNNPAPGVLPDTYYYNPYPVCEPNINLTNEMVLWFDHWLKGAPLPVQSPIVWQYWDADHKNRLVAHSLAAIPDRSVTRIELPRPDEPPLGTLDGPGGSGGDGAPDGATEQNGTTRSGDPPRDNTGQFGGPALAEPAGTWLRRDLLTSSADSCKQIFGVPRLTLTGTTVAGGGGQVFVELVDVNPTPGTGSLADPAIRSLHFQVTPVKFPIGTFNRAVDLAGVAYRLPKHHTLAIEITTGSSFYHELAQPFSVSLDSAKVELPLGPDLSC